MKHHNAEQSESRSKHNSSPANTSATLSQDSSRDALYQVKLTDLHGETLNFSDYQDHTLLIVNTASHCGLTPQYRSLESLYQTYRDQGLLIIGTPCNQFGQQEPGGASEIQAFCNLKYQISFPVSEKLEVNGDNAHLLYQILKARAPGLLNSQRVKWNFTKFLISPKAEEIERYSPMTSPRKLEVKIRRYLSKKS